MKQSPQGHQARKRFGQNFLQDQGVIRRIIRAINPKPGQHLVEIGPGLGALTEELLAGCGELEVVELDRDLIPKLQKQFSSYGDKLRIHQADALKFEFRSLADDERPLRVVGRNRRRPGRGRDAQRGRRVLLRGERGKLDRDRSRSGVGRSRR